MENWVDSGKVFRELEFIRQASGSADNLERSKVFFGEFFSGSS